MMTDEEYMRLAIEEARKGEEDGEVPIGAVLVASDGRVLASAHNKKEALRNPVRHAEIEVLEKGTEIMDKYLYDATLYVTLEPCPMCAGAMLATRLGRLVYGAADSKLGCAGTVYNLLDEKTFNHRVETIGGVLEDECVGLLREFFRKKRKCC